MEAYYGYIDTKALLGVAWGLPRWVFHITAITAHSDWYTAHLYSQPEARPGYVTDCMATVNGSSYDFKTPKQGMKLQCVRLVCGLASV